MHLIVSCFHVDQDYPDADIKNVADVKSAKKCQDICLVTDDCSKFSYVTQNYNGKYGKGIRGKCFMKSNKTVPLTTENGVTSGPKACPGKSKVSFSSYKEICRVSVPIPFSPTHQ